MGDSEILAIEADDAALNNKVEDSVFSPAPSIPELVKNVDEVQMVDVRNDDQVDVSEKIDDQVLAVDINDEEHDHVETASLDEIVTVEDAPESDYEML